MGRRYSWVWVGRHRCCFPMVVVKDPCMPARFFFFPQPDDAGVDELFRNATAALNAITTELQEAVGSATRTVRLILVENPDTGDDEPALALVRTDMELREPSDAPGP